MGNGTSTGQRRYTTYGTRDVEETAEYSNWPELAEATQTKSNQLGRIFYTYTTANIDANFWLIDVMSRQQPQK